MGRQPFNVERTAAGMQFVIPGTEKPAKSPRVEYTADGGQLVIPGAERIGGKALLDRIAQKPLRPRVGQRAAAGTPLFSKPRGQ